MSEMHKCPAPALSETIFIGETGGKKQTILCLKCKSLNINLFGLSRRAFVHLFCKVSDIIVIVSLHFLKTTVTILSQMINMNTHIAWVFCVVLTVLLFIF